MNMILLTAPHLRGNEKKYVMECIESEWISSTGAYVNKFEKAIAQYLNVENAVACNSGTSALHISLLLSGIGPGDEVIVPTMTYIAPINTVKYLGAEPIFMDCDEYLNMDMEKVLKFLEEECIFKENTLTNKISGKRVAAIIPVHIFGSICNMEKLMEISKRFKLKVIEDASESIGSTITTGKFAGSHGGTLGDFGCFSFNGNKIITTGGGGAIIAKDQNLLKKAKYYTCQAKEDGFHYVHNNIGFNYRMTSVQAAIGLAQLEQLPKFIRIKKRMYEYYEKAFFGEKNFRLLKIPSYCNSNFWFYSIYIKNIKRVSELDDIIEKFLKNKIQMRPLWKLNNEQKPYKNNQSYKIEKAYDFFKHVLNIPCSIGLKNNDLNRVVRNFKNI